MRHVRHHVPAPSSMHVPSWLLTRASPGSNPALLGEDVTHALEKGAVLANTGVRNEPGDTQCLSGTQ